jgi:formylglycine-generating enzyme
MKKIRILSVVVCMVAIVNFASAEIIRGINIDLVAINNAGNAADSTTGHGAVGYNYHIGKYEVTNAQWNSFTTVVGAPTGNPSDAYNLSATYAGAQQPTNNVSWYEAAQFCNYLTSGDKSKGVYQFSGNNANPGTFLGTDRSAAQTTYDEAYFLPTVDEWYKAAYYKADGSGYSTYTNGTNTAPIAGVQSNYNMAIGTPWNVGTGAQEQNGTFDMAGDVWEWNQTSIGSSYVAMGGSFDLNGSYLLSSFEGSAAPDRQFYQIGFRIASLPEPTTICLLGFGVLSLIRRKKLA